jgi:starch phosphorylase
MDLPMVGVSILWSYGYGQQKINEAGQVEIVYEKNSYPFLTDTGLMTTVMLFGRKVKVKAYRLEAKQFGTVPIYYLTTDVPENSEDDRALTAKLYDGDPYSRVSQEIILGIGGLQILEAAGEKPDVYHLNEGHALPAIFALLERFNGNLEETRKHTVFTTHTPVAAGNESYAASFLAEAGFFANTSLDEAIRLGGNEFSLTVAALRMSRMANGVSQLHGQVANNMWKWVDNRCPITAITNAVNLKYWQDPRLKQVKSDQELIDLKRDMKRELFDVVAKETEVVMDPDVLTVVWARRFTEYKRADLIFTDLDRIQDLLVNNKIQLLFAGKFHPNDDSGRKTFNRIIELSKTLPNVALLTNYELELSKLLKRGADIWLNTPLRPMEASGTSGMSANMNGTLHMSIYDGWAVEGTFHKLNGYIINEEGKNDYLPAEERRRQDYEAMMHLLKREVLPTYYDNKPEWCRMMRHAMQIAESYFHSDRMAIEYYNKSYKPVSL